MSGIAPQTKMRSEIIESSSHVINPPEYKCGAPLVDYDFIHSRFGNAKTPNVYYDRLGNNLQVFTPCSISVGSAICRAGTGRILIDEPYTNDASIVNRTYFMQFTSKESTGPNVMIGNTRTNPLGWAFFEYWSAPANRLYWRVIHGGTFTAQLQVQYPRNTEQKIAVIVNGNNLTFVQNGYYVQNINVAGNYGSTVPHMVSQIGNVVALYNAPWTGEFHRFMFWGKALTVPQAVDLIHSTHSATRRYI